LRNIIRCKSILGVVFIRINNYDLLNHLVKQETSNATGVIAGYTYTLDAGGKKVELLEHNGRKVDYAYDKLDRLLTEQITDGTNGNRTTGYVYDPIGNRVSKTDSVAGVTTYVYDNNDRLLTETNGTKITTSTYDNNGNNLTRGDGTSLTVNTWDIEHRLIQSVTDASTTIYQYDANGVRVSSKTSGVETRYLVDSNRPHASVVLEYNPNGTTITEYTYGLNLIAQERGGVKSFYHADGLGSTRFLTDIGGNITDAYVYDAYGNTLSSSGTTVNNYLYTGEQFDQNLGEYYLRARYYNPSQGRFTGRDPFEGMLEEPLSLNKYGYVHGNPINNTDPSGMFIGGLLDSLSAQQELIRQDAARSSGILALTTRFLLSSIGRSVGIAGTTGLAVLGAHVVNLIMSKNALKNCNATGDEDCQAGVPIVFFGQQYNGRPLRETTSHIRGAIVDKQLTPLVSAYTTRPGTHGTPGWYKTKGDCGGKGRFKYKAFIKATEGIDLVNSEITCDEYPFNSTNEGGYTNYGRGLVSLANVRNLEETPQSQLLNMPILINAGVIPGDFLSQWYGVVAIPQSIQSGWRNRQGEKRNWR
jgi:RHS repeat-associated protein